MIDSKTIIITVLVFKISFELTGRPSCTEAPCVSNIRIDTSEIPPNRLAYSIAVSALMLLRNPPGPLQY